MKAATGQDFSLEDLVLENGMLVIFSCNTCPFVIGNNDMEGWQGRYVIQSELTCGYHI